jgi:hypothetical protein
MLTRFLTASIAAVVLLVCVLYGQTPAPQRPLLEPMKPLYVLEDSYVGWRILPSEQKYASIDGKHLKEYVNEQAAISRHYRDNGHPQYWGRISGTEGDAENARWLEDKFRKIGLADVHQQSFDLPDQWMAQSWSVTAAANGQSLNLTSAQPAHRTAATPAGGLDLEAVDAGLATEGELDSRDLRGKAVFFYSTDYFSRHSTISNGAWKRIGDRGAAAIFVILAVPGNIRTQFYPVGTTVPCFSLGLQDGTAIREMIYKSKGSAPHVKVRLDVNMVPNLKTSTVWGTLPGSTDENVVIVAHRDGWFEGANDNGTGVATMIGLAEYFAKIPKEQRRRTIIFLGTSGHHDGAALSGKWLTEHKEFFAKTALLINSEHTAAEQLVLGNGTISKTNTSTALTWYVGGSAKLGEIVVKAFDAFGVATYDRPARTAAGEMGRYQTLAPSMQVIDTGYYWHSDHETPEIIPPTALAAITRAYAKIITDLNLVEIKALQRPPSVSVGGGQ